MKIIKISDLNGFGVSGNDLYKNESMNQAIIMIDKYIQANECVALDFDGFDSNHSIQVLGMLGYYMFFKWDHKKITLHNISTKVLGDFLIGLSLYDKNEVKENQMAAEKLRQGVEFLLSASNKKLQILKQKNN